MLRSRASLSRLLQASLLLVAVVVLFVYFPLDRRVAHNYDFATSLDRLLPVIPISLAKRERPSSLRLWTFASNLAAQRFYERHGFDARDRTAGDNEEEEGTPDILYEWDGRRS